MWDPNLLLRARPPKPTQPTSTWLAHLTTLEFIFSIMSLSYKRKLRPRKVQQYTQGHKAYPFYKVMMVYLRYSYLTVNWVFFFQLSFVDNLEQIKSLIFFAPLWGFPGAGKDFRKVCIPNGWNNLAKLGKISMECWCSSLQFSSLSIIIDFLPALTLTALPEAWPPGLYISFQNLYCFSGVCAVVVCFGRVEVTQARVVWVTVPVCQIGGSGTLCWSQNVGKQRQDSQ